VYLKHDLWTVACLLIELWTLNRSNKLSSVQKIVGKQPVSGFLSLLQQQIVFLLL
jgi:hypothetical protein